MKVLALCVVALAVTSSFATLRGEDRRLTELREKETWQKIYDHLFFAYVQDKGANDGKMDLTDNLVYEKTLFSLCRPALAVDPADFADSWDIFSNPEGRNMDAYMKMFLLYGNYLIENDPIFRPKIGQLSDFYKRITKAQPKREDSFSDADRKMYNQARNILFVNVTRYKPPAPGSTELQTSIEEGWSPMYEEYNRLIEEYEDAAHQRFQIKDKYDLTKPEDAINWAEEDRWAAKRVGRKWDELQTKGNYELITWANSILSQYGASSIVKEFAQAKKDLEQFETASTNKILKNPYYPTYISPSNWYDSNAKWWSTASFGTNKVSEHKESHFTETKAGGSAGWGLFSIGASGGYSKETHSRTATTDNHQIQFSYARVDIIRPWLKEHLFLLKNWYLLDTPKGTFSTGVMKNNNGQFPVLPHQMIIAKDIKVVADFSQEDEEFMKKSFEAGGSFGWGPFSFGASHKSTDETYDFKGTYKNGQLTSGPDPQVIGFMSKVVPFMPPESPN